VTARRIRLRNLVLRHFLKPGGGAAVSSGRMQMLGLLPQCVNLHSASPSFVTA